MSVLATVRKGAKDFAWFFTGIMGEDAYNKYLAHYQSIHAAGDSDQASSGMPDCDQPGNGKPPMTEREFWRDHADRQESNPQGRCC